MPEIRDMDSPMIFDSHAHYDDEAFDEDRDALLASLPMNGIGAVVNVGASISSSRASVELAGHYSFVYAAVGVHPSEVEELEENGLDWLIAELKKEKVVALGEIGLDHHWHDISPEFQKKWFIYQLELADEMGFPVIIHSRDAAKDTLDIMKEYGRNQGGVIHCFSYSLEIAREYLNMGYYIGIGGVLTFKNSRKLKEVAEYVPLDRILLETDCPYLAPAPYRGRRNSSLNLPYVVKALSEIKKVSEREIITVTQKNARKAYRM